MTFYLAIIEKIKFFLSNFPQLYLFCFEEAALPNIKEMVINFFWEL
jgi:hypothetical protein